MVTSGRLAMAILVLSQARPQSKCILARPKRSPLGSKGSPHVVHCTPPAPLAGRLRARCLLRSGEGGWTTGGFAGLKLRLGTALRERDLWEERAACSGDLEALRGRTGGLQLRLRDCRRRDRLRSITRQDKLRSADENRDRKLGQPHERQAKVRRRESTYDQ